MKGTVAAINWTRGMVAVGTDRGMTIIELLSDSDIAVGDQMRWEDETGLGGQRYFNGRKGTWMEVFAQDHYAPPTQVWTKLLHQRGNLVEFMMNGRVYKGTGGVI